MKRFLLSTVCLFGFLWAPISVAAEVAMMRNPPPKEIDQGCVKIKLDFGIEILRDSQGIVY